MRLVPALVVVVASATSARADLATGRDKLIAGDYKVAIAELAKVTGKDKPAARIMMARAQLATGDYGRAPRRRSRRSRRARTRRRSRPPRARPDPPRDRQERRRAQRPRAALQGSPRRFARCAPRSPSSATRKARWSMRKRCSI